MSMINLKNIIQALLLSNNKEMLSLTNLKEILPEFSEAQIVQAIKEINSDDSQIYTISEISKMYYIKIKSTFNNYLARLHCQDQIKEYSKIFIETIIIIAMYQPVSRQEIEDKLGKRISDNIIFELQDLQWIKSTITEFNTDEYFSTTKEFLRYFNIGSVIELEKKLNTILLDHNLEVVW